MYRYKVQIGSPVTFDIRHNNRHSERPNDSNSAVT